MSQSTYNVRLSAVTAKFEKIGEKVKFLSYLNNLYDVLAAVEVDSYDTAAGVRDVMLLPGDWDEMLILSEMNVDKAVVAVKTVGSYPMPGSE